MKPPVVCYILRSFPEPSETFIADEALSMVDVGVDLHILYLLEGKRNVVHPSAQRLIDRGKIAQIISPRRWAMVSSFLRLFFVSGTRAWITLGKALKSQARWSYFQTLSLAVWCLENKVEYLHAHFADVNFLYAATISDWTGIPFGITTHGYDIREEPIAFPIAYGLYRQADLVITISEFNRRHMVERYGLTTDSITVIHCGIDLTRFPFCGRTALLQAEPLRILNIGRLVYEKAQDVLLHAMRILHDRGMPFHLEIIGDGPLEGDLLRLRLELGLNDSVTFHGARSEAFVRERLKATDLFALSSRSEGLPIVCIEAMATGALLIATSIAGIPELVVDGVNGMLVNPEDQQGLADAIYHADRQLRLEGLEAMRVAARQSVEVGFDRKRCTEELLARWQLVVRPQTI